MIDKVCVVMTTTDNWDNAKLIAKSLISSKLAACVQIDKVYSFFRFELEEEKTEMECNEAREIRLMVKAKSANYNDIKRLIKLNHNYKLPQIIKFDITSGSTEYLEWVCKD